MRQFGLVCLAGFVGGSFSGFLILILGSFIVAHVQGATSQPISTITSSAEGGVIFGGLFGLVVFPVCYYLFLTQVAPPILFGVTLTSTVVGGALGTLVLLIPGFRELGEVRERQSGGGPYAHIRPWIPRSLVVEHRAKIICHKVATTIADKINRP